MEYLTTHVVTTNAGTVPTGSNTPVPPSGHICVIDWICWDFTSSVATGAANMGISRTDGTQTVFRMTYPILNVGESGTLFVSFQRGFPIMQPAHSSGSAGTVSAVSQTGLQMRVFIQATGATVSNAAFSFGYHYEPVAWRSTDQI